MNSITRRSLLIGAAGLAWCWPRSDRSAQPTADDQFLISPIEPSATSHFSSAFLGHEKSLGVAHCPSITQLADGRLAAVWYAGSREGGRDVGIYLARSTAPFTDWEPPRLVVDRATASTELARYVKKVGNPILFTQRDRTWLIYVSIAVGGWSCSSLNVKSSLDGGETWSASERLTLSPFANLSELVRAAPIEMQSGRMAIPIYHESLAKFPELLWLDPRAGHIACVKTRLAPGPSLLQPTIVPLGARQAVVFHRDSRKQGTWYQTTHDAGQSWSDPALTGLPNPDSSAAGLRLADGSVLLAFNDSSRDRGDLTLAVSANGCTDWRRVAVLDRRERHGFGYPSLLRGRDGLIHLVYSWNRERIRHVAFNESWLQRPSELPA